MEKFDCFHSSIYTEDCKIFLESIKEVSENYDNFSGEQMFQSENFAFDIRVQNFASHVAQNAWDILDSQGYAMNRLQTRLNEMWLQVYPKHSYMAQHVHSGYVHMSGFYFIDVPINCGRILFFDPRPGKNQINLPQKNKNDITYASEMVSLEPYPGLLVLSNSWIPHGIADHLNKEYMKVLHFNITVKDYIPPPPPAEVI